MLGLRSEKLQRTLEARVLLGLVIIPVVDDEPRGSVGIYAGLG